MITRILVTCPPMLGMIDEFRVEFARRGAEVVCPAVAQVLPEDELVEILPGCDGWIIGDDPASRRVLSAGKSGRLRAAVKWGIGVDNVDFHAAAELGIPVVNTPGMFGEEVADLAFAYMVALARELFAIDRGVRAGRWPKPRGISLSGKTLGLVGLGDIGRNIAARALGAGMRVLAYDPAVPGELPGMTLERAVWPERLEACDFLVLACALTESSRHMLNEATLKRAKRGVRIVNIARGALIDESALEAALGSGVVHSAALDVFEVEPLPRSSALLADERCILGSHNGSNTEEAVRRASLRAIELLFASLEAQTG